MIFAKILLMIIAKRKEIIITAISVRDKFIGWSKDVRLANSNSVANNYRFCLVPESGIENVGTMALNY